MLLWCPVAPYKLRMTSRPFWHQVLRVLSTLPREMWILCSCFSLLRFDVKEPAKVRSKLHLLRKATLYIGQASVQVILTKNWRWSPVTSRPIWQRTNRYTWWRHAYLASRDLSNAWSLARGRVRLIYPWHGYPLGSSAEFLEGILQEPNGVVDVVVYDREVEHMSVRLAESFRVLGQPLEALVL